MDFIHVAVRGGGGFVGTAAILTRVQIRRVPVPPMMFRVRLFVVVVVFGRFAEELAGDIHWLRRLFPLATRRARCDLLQ